MMGKYIVIIRFVISTVCTALLLWGCDRTTASYTEPKVVRKKITAQQDQNGQILTKKAVHVAKNMKAVKVEKKTTTIQAETNQTGMKKRPAAKPGIDKQPLIAKNTAAYPPTTSVASELQKQKKPAIQPKSEIFEAKQPVGAEKPSAIDKTVTSDRLTDLGSKTVLGPSTTGMPNAYNPVGKIDPFEPLFKERPVSIKKKKRKKRVPRTPLERIDLSQLKLVGIILATGGNRALVEEASGKGYVIKKGTYIGTNSGKVVKIIKEKVLVEEEFEDVFGKIKIRQREIKLPKPPGEF